MAYYVYVLQSMSSRKFYIGQTANLKDRLRRHNSGRSRYTRVRGPWELVHFEEFATRTEAIHREMELKARHSREYLEKVIAARSSLAS